MYLNKDAVQIHSIEAAPWQVKVPVMAQVKRAARSSGATLCSCYMHLHTSLEATKQAHSRGNLCEMIPTDLFFYWGKEY